ncbi:uncharacterized protein LOC109812499 isoform X3 [Cajanus cajan]|uniref:uncharacterized protein LOC109812499 isoform X3 n=1 Tax=Cajanus cajan TaxID=3821 RepID=UPI00098D763E|nr:uncharacterized protein LOC109812499 isoform X3 [Cajanus cajan]
MAKDSYELLITEESYELLITILLLLIIFGCGCYYIGRKRCTYKFFCEILFVANEWYKELVQSQGERARRQARLQQCEYHKWRRV